MKSLAPGAQPQLNEDGSSPADGAQLARFGLGGVGNIEAGTEALSVGQLEVTVTFRYEKLSAEYFIHRYVKDPNDPPQDIRAVITSQTKTGFVLKLSAGPNTNLSTLHWIVEIADGVYFANDQISAPSYALETGLVHLAGDEFISGAKTCATLNIGPEGTSPMTGTIFNLAGPSYWSSTNSVQPNPLVSFAGEGNDAGSVNAYFLTAKWDGASAQKGYTLAVENIVPADAPAYGAACAVYGGLLNYRSDTDGAGIIGVINNVAGIAPVGAAIWGLVRGPNASAGPVDGIRATSETDGPEHPQYGVIVNNSTANNAFKFGFIVAGAVDFGFCCGLGSNSGNEVVPTYPFAYRRKTDAQIRFNVNNTGVVTGPKLSVLDADVWGVRWDLVQKAGGVLKIAYGGEEVVNIIPVALGGPFVALDVSNQPDRPGFGGFRCGFGTDVCRRASDGSLALFAQNGLTVINGTLEITNLPTSDPGIAGRPYRSGNAMMISTG